MRAFHSSYADRGADRVSREEALIFATGSGTGMAVDRALPNEEQWTS